MNTAYPSSNYAIVCEFSTDNVIDNNSPDEEGLRYNLPSYNRGDEEQFAWEDVKSNTDNDSPSAVWEAYYASIAAANAVLEKIDEFEALPKEQLVELDGYENLDALRGEALVLRAYDHFILANIFCEAYRGPELSKNILGIPYITKPETTVKPHYERGNLADVYANIQKDIEAGLPLINNGMYEIPKNHSILRPQMRLPHAFIFSSATTRRRLLMPTKLSAVLTWIRRSTCQLSGRILTLSSGLRILVCLLIILTNPATSCCSPLIL